MATSVLKSKLTRRSQTTIPKAVKNALRLGAGDSIGYVIEGEAVRMVNAREADDHHDPLIEHFLEFLEHDMHRGNIKEIPRSLRQRIEQLTEGVAIDHSADITGAIAL